MKEPFDLAGVERAGKCLALIEQIAARGASSHDPEHSPPCWRNWRLVLGRPTV